MPVLAGLVGLARDVVGLREAVVGAGLFVPVADVVGEYQGGGLTGLAAGVQGFAEVRSMRDDRLMNSSKVVMRDMRQVEYGAYTAERELDFAESLEGELPIEAAWEQARQGTARFLPQGLATERHRLLVAEDVTGQAVGCAWIGFEEPRSRSTETAWLHDIRVAQRYRRCGYGRAMLAAIEALARDAGAVRLGLNVFGRNHAAIELYQACGYEVTSQQMARRLR